MAPRLAPARPDLAAHEAATRADVSVIVKELRAAFGPRLVAVLAGVKETRAVHLWADGGREVKSRATEDRLRLAYQLLKLITTRDREAVGYAWFTGLNPKLDDVSLARAAARRRSRQGGTAVAGGRPFVRRDRRVSPPALAAATSPGAVYRVGFARTRGLGRRESSRRSPPAGMTRRGSSALFTPAAASSPASSKSSLTSVRTLPCWRASTKSPETWPTRRIRRQPRG
jgi:hypothetical protein